MPTYEYKCTKCGHTFEAFQSIMDAPLSRCPKCKSAVRRVINGGLGVIFKGSGFYSTDNKRGSALTGGNGHKDKEKDKSSEKPKETKTDTTTSAGTSSPKEKTPAT
jgi:putative FmdB family regulatory protein